MILDQFFVFEGLDGAGTTTQARLLADRLTQEGFVIDLDCEPTSGPIGALIRAVLRGEQTVHPCTLAHLFAADRHEHVYGDESGILARIKRGRTIISDRYVYSSLAYQGISCGETAVSRLNSGFPDPRHIFYLEVPVETCLKRISGRNQVELFDKQQFLTKVSAHYDTVLEEAVSRGAQVHRLDGTLAREKIAAEVSSIIANSPIHRM